MFRTTDRAGELLLVRVVSMLSKLADRFSAPAEVREDPAHYGIEDDDEDEKEGEARCAPADRADSIENAY